MIIRDSHKGGCVDREINEIRLRPREPNTHTERDTNRQTDIQTDIQTDRHRQTERQRHRDTVRNRQRDKHKYSDRLNNNYTDNYQTIHSHRDIHIHLNTINDTHTHPPTQQSY